MTSASSCSSNGTVAVPYSVLLSNGFYGIVMILYCFFVTYLLFIQTMRSASGSVQKPTASIQDVASIDTKDEITHTKSSTVKSAPSGNNKSKHNYRIEEEQIKGQSSEYTRRGMLWSSHASWHLPSAPRQCLQARDLETQGLEHILDLLKKYDVDPLRGFLPHQDPLQRLPYARYHLWY